LIPVVPPVPPGSSVGNPPFTPIKFVSSPPAPVNPTMEDGPGNYPARYNGLNQTGTINIRVPKPV